MNYSIILRGNPHFYNILPQDRGREFTIAAEAAKGKPTGSGIVFITIFAIMCILFVPMGLFLPLLYKKYNKFKTVVITGILFSVSIELVQMFNWGASDINDVMTNTMGACLGYLIYSIISKILPDKLDRQLKSKKVNAFIEVFLLSVCIFVIMVTVQPWFVHNVLNIP